MVVYRDDIPTDENLEQEPEEEHTQIVYLSPVGTVLRDVTAGILGALLYLMAMTKGKYITENPRVFSLRAVLIPFIKRLIEDIGDGFLNDIFEEPNSRLKTTSPLLSTVLNTAAYSVSKVYAHRYKLLACAFAGGYIYLLNKNGDREQEL